MAEIPNHPDLLSNLPLCIIHNILTFVPIREAVRTCVLSTQWKYTWVTLPNLVFDDEEDYSDFISKDNFEELMENLIRNVLLCHKGPIYKFQMYVSFSPSSETMDQLILCLSRKDIRELIIELNYDDDDWLTAVRLPSSIYSCEKLTYLRLSNCVLVTPPSSFNGFLFLREFLLHGVNFDIIQHALVAARIVVGSPNLEKFTIYCETVHPIFTPEKVSVMDFQSALHSTFEKLRAVTMMNVSGYPFEMEFIKYLLENSPVLEVMLLLRCDGKKKQISRKLLLNYCTCASPIAKIIVL